MIPSSHESGKMARFQTKLKKPLYSSNILSDILLIHSLIILSLEHALLFFSGLIYILKFLCPLYLNLKFRHCYFTVHPHITVNG